MPKTAKEIEEQIDRLTERMDRLEVLVHSRDAAPGTPDPERRPWEDHLPPWIRFSDKEALRPVIDRAFRAMGISDEPLPISVRELRERMVRNGVRPEDRVFNTTREEMRGEKE